MQRETRSVGENTRDYATIGDARGYCSLSSPRMSPSSPRTLSPNSGGAELDLTYITDRLIVMSFPASGLESIYHTSLLKVLKMLQTKHMEKYKIVNVSERRYDILQLNEPGQVLDYGWPDHLAPPLDRLHKIISSIHSWLLLDTKNVAVIHCKSGMSRIGVVIATYIQFSKNSPSPQGALDWFALRRYYDSKLEGATQPSQKRYVEYFDNIYEKKLKISNKRLYFRNIIMHGIPYYGNESGLYFFLKIYQSYHLKHTTKTYCVTPSSQRAYISIEDGILLNGDIMIKCVQRNASSQNIIFRLQFHTDAIEGCVAVFGKYDLDEAFTDPRFLDSCYIEFLFSPSNEQQRLQEQAECIEKRLNELSRSKHSFTSELDALITRMSSPIPIKQQLGIFDMEREMAGLPETDRGRTIHVPGPLNGNPYAQIDPTLKEKLRTRQDVVDGSYNVSQGIEDLDDLLGQINDVNMKPDVNGNTQTMTNKNSLLHKKFTVTKKAPLVFEGKMQVENRGVLHQAPTIQYTNQSKINDDVFRQDISNTDSINDLLFELDNSPLNSTQVVRKPNKRNMSAYDNDDSMGESETETTDSSASERRESVEGIIEISPGTVAQHIRNLNRVFFNGENTAEYNRKYGVPLAGINSPELVEEKVAKFNSRSVAPGFCSSPVATVYHSQGAMTRINYEAETTDNYDGAPILPSYSKHNGHVVFDSDSTDFPSDDTSLPSHHDDYNNKTGNLLSRSDSAYGESMRSSSSTPTSTTQPVELTIDGSFTHVGHKDDENITDSYSPRSDGYNGKSSGIGSITSSMASLDEEQHGFSNDNNDFVTSEKKHNHQTQEELHHTQPTIYVPPIQQVFSQPVIQYTNKQTTEDSYQKTTHKSKPPVALPETQEEIFVGSIPVEPIESKPSKKHSLTVVEEHIQSAQVQREVEFLNDDIFKNLLEDDLKLASFPPSKMPLITPSTHDRLTTSSTEDEVQVTDVPERKQPQPKPMVKPVNTNWSQSSQMESNHVQSNHVSASPVTPSTQYLNQRSPQISPISNDLYVGDNSVFQRQLSHGSTNSDTSSPRSPSGNRYPTSRNRRRGGSASSNSSVSSAELFHEVIRYPSIKFDKDTMSLWYKPNISREDATKLLRDREAGAFVVRDSQSYEGAFGLAVKVETPPLGVLQQVGGDLSKVDLDNELVRHFLIEPSKKGVRLKGSNNEPAFPSLVALVYQHTLTKMALPVPLVIPNFDSVDGVNGTKSSLTESQLLEKGAACNLVYLGCIDVESLSGDGAVHYAMNKVIAQNSNLKTTTVNIKVNQTGITLTDNQRKLFFRRHYPMQDIIHCGIDPKGRKINLKPITESIDREVGCFGFVVRKEPNSLQNACHICAELDTEQPASAVINFIHKAMRYAKV